MNDLADSYLNELRQQPGVVAAFVEKIPCIDVYAERSIVMERLKNSHVEIISSLGFSLEKWKRAEQIHGNAVAVVEKTSELSGADGLPIYPAVDGIVCGTAGYILAIYVADCGPLWLLDQRTGAYGLLHSGKKGTEGNILAQAVKTMNEEYGTQAEDLIVVLGPCIRPPYYEVDISQMIAHQARELGVGKFKDCGLCTAQNAERFYSYRTEKGFTGRMMALIGKKINC